MRNVDKHDVFEAFALCVHFQQHPDLQVCMTWELSVGQQMVRLYMSSCTFTYLNQLFLNRQVLCNIAGALQHCVCFATLQMHTLEHQSRIHASAHMLSVISIF